MTLFYLTDKAIEQLKMKILQCDFDARSSSTFYFVFHFQYLKHGEDGEL